MSFPDSRSVYLSIYGSRETPTRPWGTAHFRRLGYKMIRGILLKWRATSFDAPVISCNLTRMFAEIVFR